MGISLVEPEQQSQGQNRRVSLEHLDSERPLQSDPKGDANSSSTSKTLCILTEYLEQGSLADILYGKKKYFH